MKSKRLVVIFVLFALLIATTSVAFASSDMDSIDDDSDFIDIDIPDEDLDDSDNFDDNLDDSDDWDDDDDSDDWDDDDSDDWDDDDDSDDWDDDDSDDWDDDDDWEDWDDDDSDDWDDDDDWEDWDSDEDYLYEFETGSFMVTCLGSAAFYDASDVLGNDFQSVSKSIDLSQIAFENQNNTSINTGNSTNAINIQSESNWDILTILCFILLGIIMLL